MPDSIIEGYAAGLFRLVQAEGELDQVEDELYRFGKVLESNYELKQALSDQGIDRAQRIKVLDELLGEKVSPHSLGLLSFVVEQGHGRRHAPLLGEGLPIGQARGDRQLGHGYSVAEVAP